MPAHKLPASESATLVAHLRLESWLASHPPRTPHQFADRVLARTVQAPDEYSDADLRALLVGRAPFVNALRRAFDEGAVSSMMIPALSLAWSFRQHGIPKHELESDVIQRLEPALLGIDAWDEPFRTEVLHWAHRLGLIQALKPERPASDPFRRAHQFALEGLFLSDFGRRPVERGWLPRHRALIQALLHGPRERVAPSWTRSASLVAPALIVELAHRPIAPANLFGLARRLVSEQAGNGGFETLSRPQLESTYRSATLAVMALSRFCGGFETGE